MKMAIEMFTMVITLTLACILFSSIITSNNQNLYARDFYNVAVNRIEDSNCNEKIIELCKEEAHENGYDLEVKDVTLYEEHPSILVTMTYNVTFPVFRLFGDEYKRQVVIEGYAR
mgnify:CR=1 FL=1